MAQFDITAVTPEETSWQTSTADNPADQWLRESFDLNQAKQVKVPASQAISVVNLLHGASRNTGLGVSIRVRIGTDEFAVSKDLRETLVSLKDRAVIVKFRGKNRKQHKVAAPVTVTETTEETVSVAQA